MMANPSLWRHKKTIAGLILEIIFLVGLAFFEKYCIQPCTTCNSQDVIQGNPTDKVWKFQNLTKEVNIVRNMQCKQDNGVLRQVSVGIENIFLSLSTQVSRDHISGSKRTTRGPRERIHRVGQERNCLGNNQRTLNTILHEGKYAIPDFTVSTV